MESEDVITFCQSDLLCTSFAAFDDMRKKGELCDLTLRIGDRSFKAHKVVLAAGIPHFRSLLTSNTEAKERDASVGNLDPAVVESLIDFAYSSRVNISTGNVESLLRASEFLQLPQVSDACVEFLTKRLRVSNAVKVHTLGHSYNNATLIQKSDEFMRQNFEQFSISEDFACLPASCVKEIISQDDLEVSSEVVVFEAVINWVKHSPSDRHAALPELLTEVRLSQIPTDSLINRVSSEELIRTSIPCRDHLDEVKNYLLSKNASAFLNLKTQPRNCKGGIYAICRNPEPAGGLNIYRCDFGNETWRNVASAADTRFVIGVTAVSDVIYIFFEKTIQTFHPKTLEWQVLEPRPDRLCDAGVVSHGHQIYFFGGSLKPKKIRCFDTLQKRWKIERTMRTFRLVPAAVSLGDSMFVTGGMNSTLRYQNVVEKYSPSADRWDDVAPMITARGNHGIATMDGKIYVCGGYIIGIKTSTCNAEMYDSSINQWNSICSMRTPKHVFKFIPHNRKIYTFGSGSGDEVYDPGSDRWKVCFGVPHGFLYGVAVPYLVAHGSEVSPRDS